MWRMRIANIKKYEFDPTSGAPYGWIKYAVKFEIDGIICKSEFNKKGERDEFYNKIKGQECKTQQ